MVDAQPSDDAVSTLLAELVIDIAREVQLRASQTTPVVPLTPTQGQIMRYVHAHPGCSASDIADGSGLQRTNVSTALRDLRSRGYITSSRDEEDGRAIRIFATPLADEIIASLRASWSTLIARAWRRGDGDGADPRTDAVAVLSRIRDGLGADRATNGFRDAPPPGEAAVADSTQTDAALVAAVPTDPSEN